MGKPWKSQKQSYLDAVEYMKGRRNGTITSLKTPWTKVNRASLDGFEWQSMIVIGARPGAGKTLMKDQLLKDVFKLNPTTKMRVLEFSLEMVGTVAALRGFSSHVQRSYKALCSVEEEGPIDEDILRQCLEYAKEREDLPIDVVEDAPTVHNFGKIIEAYMKEYSTLGEGVDADGKPMRHYINTVITLDHSVLLKNNHGTKGNTELLADLGTTITRIKRLYPITFIILSQLNRAIDHPERNENGRYGNYVLPSDIYGGDSILQHADLVIGLNRPGKHAIESYGPEKFHILDQNTLAMHFLKVRNGDVALGFFEFQGHNMRIIEMPPVLNPADEDYDPKEARDFITNRDKNLHVKQQQLILEDGDD